MEFRDTRREVRAATVLKSALGIFGTVIRYRESRNFPKLFLPIYFENLCVKFEDFKEMSDLQQVLVEPIMFAFNIGDEKEHLKLGKVLLNYMVRLGQGTVMENAMMQHPSIVEDNNQASILLSMGGIHRDLGNWNEAERCFQQALAIAQKENNQSDIATALGMLGYIEQCRGNWDEAERLYRQCLALRTELGDREGIATSIGCLGENELGRGNLDAAEQLLTEALGKMQTLGMTWHIAEANYCFAQLHRQRGNTEVAQQHYDTAHQIFQQLGAAKDVEKIEREWHKSD